MSHRLLYGAGVCIAAFTALATWAGQPPGPASASAARPGSPYAWAAYADARAAYADTRYPYAGAVCEFGAAGGPDCVSPRDPGNMYDWGYWKGRQFSASDPWGYEYRNCTSYVAWRLARAGVPAELFADLGDASQWIANVSGEPGVRVNHTPSAGAVAAWDLRGVGHVAWVVSVKHSGVTVADYNYAGTGVYDEHLTGSRPNGYIHFPTG